MNNIDSEGDVSKAGEDICCKCGKPSDGWPNAPKGFLCQLCWEAESSAEWWRMSSSLDWLRKKAEMEDGCLISVGGLVMELEGKQMDFMDINGELSRTYIFPNGERIHIKGVSKLCVRPSGNHRVETSDGKKYIVSPGWLAIEINAGKWSL